MDGGFQFHSLAHKEWIFKDLSNSTLSTDFLTWKLVSYSLPICWFINGPLTHIDMFLEIICCWTDGTCTASHCHGRSVSSWHVETQWLLFNKSGILEISILSRARGGVSSKTRRHGADKTRSQQPFSPLEKVDYSCLTKLTNYCYTKLSYTTGYFTKAGWTWHATICMHVVLKVREIANDICRLRILLTKSINDVPSW